ncbi:DUF2301 domain-containing membrane protein [Spirulina major CS-329]|uniref:DUF2301 domain-containing membrane protein n=1 Tax=Spirulina TaxID=1154 RepID=UPI00232B91CE|nr:MULTISPECIES: DUF2301 domain-containing membrane protein [Spirulina]MDB9494429.1 DUF2301 domain-containing membrane protein [Spirulina subsalsa CS-330]MDB9505263.1 DUF2301 domain-containing membrane protein [Spirulina major CS-329]
MQSSPESIIYQGQFGEFTITDHDRREVVVYRTGLAIAALSFALATLLVTTQAPSPGLWQLVTVLFALFTAGLGVSLWFIHIYLRPLHRALQAFWAIGTIASGAIALTYPEPLPLALYHHPLLILGVGFTFAALTGIYFKEAFCFNRLETKLLTPLVPLLLLGHLFGGLPVGVEQGLLIIWAVGFLVFSGRKVVQAIPPDLGDKSVFAELQRQAQARSAAT